MRLFCATASAIPHNRVIAVSFRFSKEGISLCGISRFIFGGYPTMLKTGVLMYPSLPVICVFVFVCPPKTILHVKIQTVAFPLVLLSFFFHDAPTKHGKGHAFFFLRFCKILHYLLIVLTKMFQYLKDILIPTSDAPSWAAKHIILPNH